MKTFAAKEKQSPCAARRSHHHVHQALAAEQQGRQLALRKILRPAEVQTKQDIGKYDGKYERETDQAVAPSPASATSGVLPGALGGPPPIQRSKNVDPGEEEDEILQAQTLTDQITPLVQRQAEPPAEEEEMVQPKSMPEASATMPPSLEARVKRFNGSGRPLDPSTRAFFEPRFGYNFGQVRVHTDSNATGIAWQIKARAFTQGKHVAMAPGEYQPNSPSGQRLLGHELAHVIQQDDNTNERISRVPTRSGIQASPPRYTYSTNWGWIDWSHASTSIPATLIRQVQSASASLQTAGAGPSAGDFTSPTMRSGAAGIVLSSASMQIRVRRPLSADEVLAVALSIFKEISVVFEMQQRWTQLVGESSFSQEDLPSNLVGFYMNARNYSRANVNRFCGALDAAGSLAEYERDHDFQRNTNFYPPDIPASRWPNQLSSINDRSASSLYEVRRITGTQGTQSFRFRSKYRVVGLINETDLFIISVGGTRFTAAHDVQVVPTYRAYHGTHGLHGHVQMTQVRPRRVSDRTRFRRHNISWPIYLPDPVLRPV